MVHNGIEYGLMAAYAEGLNILKHANVGKQHHETDAETTPLRNPEHYQYDFNLADVTEVWRRGSVVASWLLDLTAISLLEQPTLEKFSGRVSDSGEGRWTILAGIESGAPAPGADGIAVRALLFARRRRFRVEDSVRDALPVWRARRKEVADVGCATRKSTRSLGTCNSRSGRKRSSIDREQLNLNPNPKASPCVMVIFGATGDLTKRKLIPALCNLAQDDLLPKQFAIIGFAGNDETTESFRKSLGEEIPKYVAHRSENLGLVRRAHLLRQGRLRRRRKRTSGCSSRSPKSTSSTTRRAIGSSTWRWRRDFSPRSSSNSARSA